MKPLTCAATRRRLEAFHDGELSVADQIAVSAHLEWCDECAAIFAEMRAVGAALRAAAPGRRRGVDGRADGFSRRSSAASKAERDASFVGARPRDVRRHAPGLRGSGAAVAATVCVVVMIGMMRFADRFAAGLAGRVSTYGHAVECETTSEVPDALRVPRALDRALPARQRERRAGRGLHARRDRDPRRARRQSLSAPRQQPRCVRPGRSDRGAARRRVPRSLGDAADRAVR